MEKKNALLVKHQKWNRNFWSIFSIYSYCFLLFLVAFSMYFCVHWTTLKTMEPYTQEWSCSQLLLLGSMGNKINDRIWRGNENVDDAIGRQTPIGTLVRTTKLWSKSVRVCVCVNCMFVQAMVNSSMQMKPQTRIEWNKL